MRTRTAYRIAPRVQEAIEELAARRYGPPQIHRELELKFKNDLSAVPSVRTIERIVVNSRVMDRSPTWGLTTGGAAGPSEATSFALEVLAAVIETTVGRTRTLTISDVKWISAIHSADRDLDAWMAYRLARRYQARDERKETTEDLDAWLAFAPWKSREHLDRYEAAVEAGWIDRLPMAVDLRSAVIMTTAVLGEEYSEVDATSGPATPPSLWESTKEFKRLRDERKADGQTGSE